MATISSLFPPANATSHELEYQLTAYESGENTSHQHELAIQQTLDNLTRTCAEMNQALNKEPVNLRPEGERKVRTLSEKVEMIRIAFERARKRNPHSSYSQQAQAASTRSQLFAGASSSSDTRAQMSAIDSFARQQDSLGRSHAMMDDLQEMGTRALDSLRSQRGTLKSAHRKALDMANVLGMSNSLMKLIGREDQTNAWITYGCMIFSVIVVLTIWWYFR